MEHGIKKQYVLSVIIPISKMAGRLQNFEITMSNLCNSREIQVIVIHDIQDSQTGIEIRNILKLYQSGSVTFVEEHTGNPGGARNLGMKYVEGYWVNFVDSDDIYSPSCLLELLRKGKTLGASAVISNYEIVDSVTNHVKLREHKKNFKRVALNPGLWRWTFRADLIKDTKFSELNMGEDQKFLYEFCQIKQIIKFADLTTYRYTTNQKLQLTNQSQAKRDLFQALLEILKIRNSAQSNFDEFTETMLLKISISTILHGTLRKKLKTLIILISVLIPLKKSRLRYSKILI